MKAPRIALLVIGIISVALFVCVRHDYKTTPSGEVTEAVMRIGFPPSPWFERVERGSLVTSDIRPLSLGSLFGLLAAGSFLGYARLRQAKPAPAPVR